MPQLTDKQLVVLNAATTRKDGQILPLPASLKLPAGPAASLLAGLRKRGLIEERIDSPSSGVDSGDGSNRRQHTITAAGLAALGAEPDNAKGSSRKCGQNKSTKPRSKRKNAAKSAPEAGLNAGSGSPRTGTKLATLLDLLRRDSGATLDEIMAAIEWQAHSLRGAISGTVRKKLGLTVTSEIEEGRGRVYRIVSGTAEANR